jgi:glycosyltransferase involved in cell wall biosynthesis
VPDTTTLSWMPAALSRVATLLRSDRPDAVVSISPPESTHLVGLALHAAGVSWIADLREGWTFEPPTRRPYLGFLDRALERTVVRRADVVTAATGPLVTHLARVSRSSTRVVEVANGFDPRSMERASDERSSLDQSRFSLVYTGTGILDGKDPRPFLRALQQLLAQEPSLRRELEVVFAGNFTREEVDAMLAPELGGVARFLGRVEHRRALGLQRAADGLLLITTRGATSIATGKIYEYLAAGKPVT